jgi:hypothetical protein
MASSRMPSLQVQENITIIKPTAKYQLRLFIMVLYATTCITSNLNAAYKSKTTMLFENMLYIPHVYHSSYLLPAVIHAPFICYQL